MMTAKKAPERLIMMASPSRRRLDVARSGQARRMAPIRNAPMAQVRGKRKAGTKNMQNPVAMPRGGIRSFLAVTAVRPSRTRQRRTPQSPRRETMAVKTVLDSMEQAFPIWCYGRVGLGGPCVNYMFDVGKTRGGSQSW